MQALAEASGRLAQKLYASSSRREAAARGRCRAARRRTAGDDDVVDAEFEEVDKTTTK